MYKNHLPTIGIVLLSLQGVALSQSAPCPTPRQGILSASGAALSLDQASQTPATGNSVQIKEPGQQTEAPLPWTTNYQITNSPGYSLEAMFVDLPNTAAVAAAVQFSAISTGASTIPEPSDPGRVGYPVLGNRWMNVTVSFTPGSQGLTGSWLDKRTDGCLENSITIDPGADLYGYYYDNAATGISTTLLGQSVIEQRTEDLRYEDVENVDGLDWALGILANGGSGPPQGAIFRRTTSFYFALSSDCIVAVNAACGDSFALDEFSELQPANVHTVYKLDWSPANGWDGPLIQFDLSQGSAFTSLYVPGDAIDALAFDDANKIAVFSLAQMASQARPQLLIYSQGLDSCEMLRNHAGDLVFTELGGAAGDDVDAVCIVKYEFDPTNSPQGLSALLGTPLDYIPAVPGIASDPMGFSVTLDLGQGSGPGVCIVQATGWGSSASGPNAPSGGMIHLFASADQTPEPINWTHVSSLPRDISKYVYELRFPTNQEPSGGQFINFFALFEGPFGVLVPSFVIRILLP